MGDLNILFHGEVQLVDWSDSRSSGPIIKLRFSDPSFLDVFRGMDTAGRNKTGHILHVTIAEGDIATLAETTPADEPKPAHPYSGPSALLWKSSFFRTPAVWAALGLKDQCEENARAGRVKTAQLLAWDAMKARLGYEYMADVPPTVVIAWAAEAGVERHLPAGYREFTE